MTARALEPEPSSPSVKNPGRPRPARMKRFKVTVLEGGSTRGIVRTSWAVLMCGLGLFGCATASNSSRPPEPAPPAPPVAATAEPAKKTPAQLKDELLAMLSRETSPRGR